MSLQPTVRCLLLFLAGLPVALLPVLFGEGLWAVWLVFVAGSVLLLGLDLILAAPTREIEVSVEAPPLLFIGEGEPARVTLSGRRGLAGRVVEALLDLSDILVPQPAQRVRVPQEGSAELAFGLVASRRGDARLERLWLRWEGPFGLIRRRTQRAIGQGVAIVPNTRAVQRMAIRFFNSREIMSGLKNERYLGDGSEFESLREFVPGFDPRAIDWKASARHRKLLVRQFRAERNHQIVLALDTGHLMREPLEGIPKLDHAINAGLILAYVSLRTGDRVGLFAFDAKVRLETPPAGGVRAFHKIRSHTAELDYATEETNFTLGLTHLLTKLRRRSLVVVFTDFVDTITAELMVENLGRLARRHVVIFVALRDPDLDAVAQEEPRNVDSLNQAVVAAGLSRERDLVLKRLQQHRAFVVDAKPADVSVGLLNRYLDIKRKELV